MPYKMGRDGGFVPFQNEKPKEENTVKKLDAKIAALQAELMEANRIISEQRERIAQLEAPEPARGTSR